jgi:DUF971 family protein
MAPARSRSSPAGATWASWRSSYAIKIGFDDLHDTGIFSWDYLHQLGREQAEIWATYLAAVDQQGLSREPPRRA